MSHALTVLISVEKPSYFCLDYPSHVNIIANRVGIVHLTTDSDSAHCIHLENMIWVARYVRERPHCRSKHRSNEESKIMQGVASGRLSDPGNRSINEQQIRKWHEQVCKHMLLLSRLDVLINSA